MVGGNAMIKVGLIGSQSMHARELARVCNLPQKDGTYRYEDVRVSAICGLDDEPEHTKEVAEKNAIPNIVQSPEELFEHCNAVMLLQRRGEGRVECAIPFLEKGYPVFLDKPVCRTPEEIALLKQTVSKRDCILTGGSGVKYCNTIKELQTVLSEGKLGKVSGATFDYHADITSRSGGIFFYGSHSVEMMLTLFGYDPISVQAHVQAHDNFTVTVRYADKMINIVLNNNWNTRFITVYGSQETVTYKLDESETYEKTMDEFVKLIRNQTKTESLAPLVKPIEILMAIDKSIQEKREVRV